VSTALVVTSTKAVKLASFTKRPGTLASSQRARYRIDLGTQANCPLITLRSIRVVVVSRCVGYPLARKGKRPISHSPVLIASGHVGHSG